jgi:hypothetical protein
MKEKILLLLIFLIYSSISYSQSRRTEYINCAAISNNMSCGVGEIFIIQEFTKQKNEENEITLKNEIGNELFLGYPNPVTDFFYFQTSLDIKFVKIFGVDGKLIRTAELTATKCVDMSNLKAGFYMLIFDNPKINQLKIIKH